ncbi:alpha/beta hydrolase [Flavisolibacter nicotianae]|uniref:alpha/beta hydrolase n=1 Tax=Flavisolibacter nicotianae TaxID=2364882 RepID=UPI000EB3EAFF|nr:alpha/beta hydrolase-fold protein [Flavisolibacter nicotianae]
MLLDELSTILVEQKALASHFLKRYVIVDVYHPKQIARPSSLSLLVLNDGQNLDEMQFAPLLNGLLETNQIAPVVCVGVHCNKDRIDEYGTAENLDFAGRGKKANAYQRFLVEELLPFLHLHYGVEQYRQTMIAGFSMGGLSAIDTLWNYPDVFSVAGVFSGSLWWRSRDLHDEYDDDRHRIIHQVIRKKSYHAGRRFYFMTGSLDETADRNNNGVIDSIDDTLDLIRELETIGYENGSDICYVNDQEGRHDLATWSKALPHFLLWALPPLATQMLFDAIDDQQDFH